MTAREVLDGIKGRLAAATPGPWFASRFWVGAGEDHSDPDTEVAKAAFLSDASFIAAAPVDVARLTRAVEAALDACDIVIDNRDGHKPPGPPHPSREQVTAVRIRAVIENALNPKEGQ